MDQTSLDNKSFKGAIWGALGATRTPVGGEGRIGHQDRSPRWSDRSPRIGDRKLRIGDWKTRIGDQAQRIGRSVARIGHRRYSDERK